MKEIEELDIPQYNKKERDGDVAINLHGWSCHKTCTQQLPGHTLLIKPLKITWARGLGTTGSPESVAIKGNTHSSIQCQVEAVHIQEGVEGMRKLCELIGFLPSVTSPAMLSFLRKPPHPWTNEKLLWQADWTCHIGAIQMWTHCYNHIHMLPYRKMETFPAKGQKFKQYISLLIRMIIWSQIYTDFRQ